MAYRTIAGEVKHVGGERVHISDFIAFPFFIQIKTILYNSFRCDRRDNSVIELMSKRTYRLMETNVR